MKTVVLLGAGASHGSVEVYPGLPPLGYQLFDALDKLGGVASKIPEDLKSEFRKDFEVGMVKYYDFADGHIMAFQRELAGYLAQFYPGQNNAYRDLAKLLGSQDTAYVSLNYDLLLEGSIASLRRYFHYQPSPSPADFLIVKIHGSSNFWPDLGNNIFIDCEAGQNAGGDIDAPVVPLDQKSTVERCNRDVGFAPAIAMYAVGKDVRVCRDYIQMQQGLWRDLVDQAECVIVIGVRVNPRDRHIWDTLAVSAAQLDYFGLEADEEAYNAWVATTGRLDSAFIRGDFAGALAHLRAETEHEV